MRSRPLVVAILASLVLAPALAFAAKSISVQQLEETVTSAHASHQTDDALTRQLENVKLTERLTGDALQKLIALSPGPKTTQALDAIAGLSAFLDPPSKELPATPAPDPRYTKRPSCPGRSTTSSTHCPPCPTFWPPA